MNIGPPEGVTIYCASGYKIYEVSLYDDEGNTQSFNCKSLKEAEAVAQAFSDLFELEIEKT